MHGVQNYKTKAKYIVVEAKVNHATQFYRIKSGGGVRNLKNIESKYQHCYQDGFTA